MNTPSVPGAHADLDQAARSVAQSFDRLAPLMRRTKREALGRVAGDLQPAAWAVFERVSHRGRIQSRAIAEELGMDRGAVSRHLKELRRLDLIDAVRDVQDARIVWVTPTDHALEWAEAVMVVRAQRVRSVLEQWSEAEVVALAELFERFATATMVYADN